MLKQRMTTARRAGDAGVGMSLRMRRVWFADGQTPEADKPANDQPKAQTVPDWVRDPEEAYRVIQNTRAEAKENRIALDELKKQLEELQKKPATDPAKVDDLAKTLDDMQKRLQEKEKNELRLSVALELGLPKELAVRLVGSTEEELRKDGEALKALIPSQSPQTPKRQNTTPTPGGAPVGETDEQKRARLFGGGNTSNPIFKKS
jgi:hypothetical protein